MEKEPLGFSDLVNGNHEIQMPLLDRSTRFSLWQVKMCVVLVQMDLDEALLGLDKMLSSLTKVEKEWKDRKALS